MAVHHRHLELVLEVAHRAESPDDQRGPRPPRELHQQPLERLVVDSRVISNRGLQHRQTFLHGEQGGLGRVARHGDDHLIGEDQAAAGKIGMAPGRRIEGAGIDGDTIHGA